MDIKKTDMLLVVDMQNVYLPGQKWACDRIQEAIKYITKLVRTFPETQVVYTKYIASKDPKGVWAEYNRLNGEVNVNQWLNEYVDELKSYLNEGNTYVKSKYSCCENPELRERVRCCERIFIAGVVAECCVLSTIYDLIDMGKKVVYLSEGIAGETREKEEMVKNILSGLSPITCDLSVVRSRKFDGNNFEYKILSGLGALQKLSVDYNCILRELLYNV